jgi:hypothetical protein
VVLHTPDDRVDGGVAGLRQHRLGHLQRQALHVAAVERVVADLGEVASVQQVEDPQVEEERVVGLTGEALPADALAPIGRTASLRSAA